MVREGLHMVLESQPDISVVGEATNGEEAVEMALELRPDVVLMDVTMPGMNGIEATRAIVAAGLPSRVLGLTVHENQEYFFRMMAAGASGYILKGATSNELVDAIRSVHGGGAYLTPGMVKQMISQFLDFKRRALEAGDDGLTAREAEVVRAFTQGMSNQQVADALHVSVFTVQSHRRNIMKKLGLDNRHQLMMYAMSKGYLDDLPQALP